MRLPEVESKDMILPFQLQVAKVKIISSSKIEFYVYMALYYLYEFILHWSTLRLHIVRIQEVVTAVATRYSYDWLSSFNIRYIYIPPWPVTVPKKLFIGCWEPSNDCIKGCTWQCKLDKIVCDFGLSIFCALKYNWWVIYALVSFLCVEAISHHSHNTS